MAVEKKNILLTGITTSMQYKGTGGRGKKKIPPRDRSPHANYISEKYESFLNQVISQKQVAAIKMKGMYAEFSGMQDYELVTKSLENRRSGIRLLNVQNIDGHMKATVYIPEGKENFFRSRIAAYADEETSNGNPKHADLICSIEDIKQALLESFWTDSPGTLPNEVSINCEIWLRYDMGKAESERWNSVEEKFHNVCDELGISVDKSKHILFPERIVKLATANRQMLTNLLDSFEYITEIRRASEPTSFFTALRREDQKSWANDLLSRCSFVNSGVSVCLLDAGMNAYHPLIAPALLDNGLHALKDEWGTGDNVHYNGSDGHGTEMAGIILYNDLQEALESDKTITVNHKIESVKILPNRGQNPRDLYGALTQNAVSIAEIDNPSEKRIICMAVTAKEELDNPDETGKPTSWSAALDEITSGATEEGNHHRLFLVSAGNVHPSVYTEGVPFPERNSLELVQNPGQSWNAITVGGYANKIDITLDDYKGFSSLAERGNLSPYSSTSVAWKKSWPVKPEVLFDAGNVATNGVDYLECDDLSLLTTFFEPSKRLYSTIWGTSAATAQAAYFSAQLVAEYPDLWPETIRALIIHSADWTDVMRRQFCPEGNDTTKGQRRNLLRHCGYGIPNLDRAIQCANNSVNMIVQGELQPFEKGTSSPKMKEMHILKFPWPKEVLLELSDAQVKLKVTLSYYIEPSPGEVGWKDRYRYPSCGLRFEVNSTNQSLEEFKAKVNVLARAEDHDEDNSNSGSSGNNWYLGPNNRNVGSIHSDYIIANAADLCESRYVAVYPVGGWWKERPYLGKSENKVRYALIVSLSTPETNVDLYTPIITQIGTTIPVVVPVRD